MPAPIENQNAAKSETKDVPVVLRVTRSEKSRWVRAANRARKTLAAWIRDLADSAS